MALFKKKFLSDDEQKKLIRDSGLRHIAFIMDGNGRWATSKGLPREAGHARGAAAFRHILSRAHDLGIEVVTVYALSTENLKLRPAKEIAALMRLLGDYIDEGERDREKNNIRFTFIGDVSGLGSEMAEKCRHLENITKDCRLMVNVAVNYGGRAEIARAATLLAASGEQEITEDMLSEKMYTAASGGDPDLIVRTAGEVRVSNFLLWQGAYSEFYFTDTLWPDFGDDALALAISEFSKRRRKFGAVK